MKAAKFAVTAASLLTLVFASGTNASGRFSAQAGASVGSVMIGLLGYNYNAMNFNASGTGFYEIAPTHKIGGSVAANYLSFISFDFEDYAYSDDDDEPIYLGISSAQFGYLSFVVAPAYRFEPQPNVYVQAALNIDFEIMHTYKFGEESRGYDFFQEYMIGYEPIYIAELSTRYNFIGVSYGVILNDDYLSRHNIGASLYAQITDKFELAPSVLYRFGKDRYEKLDFNIGVNYLF